MAGWRSRCVRGMDGWMDGEIDGCVGEGDARIDRQMHRWRTDARSLPSRPGGLSRGAAPVLSPEACSVVGRWPGPCRGGGTAAGLLMSHTKRLVPVQPPGRLSPPACQPCGRLAARRAPKRPTGPFQGWRRGLVPPRRFWVLAASPVPGSSPGAVGFACPWPCPLPPALRPGSCTGAKAANSQLFSCNLKIRRFGKYLANEWEDEERRN